MFRKLRIAVVAAALVVATYATAAEMAGPHPDIYVVKRGDTLWDISGRFLQKPWLWPEIWQANPQIQNPHLIFPGDVISLAYLDRVAIQAGPRQDAPINAIPLSDIEPFLKNLRVTDSFKQLPRVVGLEEDRLRSSASLMVYTLGQEGAQVGQRFAILRPTLRYTNTRFLSNGEFGTYQEDLDFRGNRAGSQTIDWDRSWNSAALNTGWQRGLLGYELAQVAVGTLTRGVMPGSDTSTVTLEGNGHEVRVGDRLVPVEAQPYDLQFIPHVPAVPQPDGRLQIMAVANGMTSGGPRDVVAISGGSREGIDNGTVFSIWREGSHVVDRYNNPNTSRANENRRGRGDLVLPDEYAGHVMVFRTFDKVSYGLVMEGIKPTRVGYTLKHPDPTY
ncbi:MAG: LysM peptidoglycan-binding domain-containing protein [Pseudoxanthomonas sp.]|nr:LysM peptidoglycan-binding domain-containing protein [Pseudoxanthomonas sp.]